MIYNKTINGLKVFIKDNDPFYEQVLNDFLTCRVKTLKVFRSIDDTKVILIDTARGPLVLKVYAPKHKMIERFLKSCVKKDYYEKHKYFELKINNEKRIYEIFSVGVVEKSSKEEHMQFNYKTDDEWLNHFNRLKDNINVDVSGKDSILILQTCLFGRYSNKLLTISGKLIYAK